MGALFCFERWLEITQKGYVCVIPQYRLSREAFSNASMMQKQQCVGLVSWVEIQH